MYCMQLHAHCRVKWSPTGTKKIAETCDLRLSRQVQFEMVGGIYPATLARTSIRQDRETFSARLVRGVEAMEDSSLFPYKDLSDSS